MNELTVVKVEAIPAISFSPDTVKLGAVKEKFPISKIPTDLTDTDNYDLVKSGAKAYQQIRLLIESDHKKLKDPYRKVGLQLDKAKNTMLEELKPLELAYKTAKVDFDNIEKKRIEAIEKEKQEADDAIVSKLAWIGQYSSRLISKPALDVEIAIADLKNEKFDWCGGFIDSAKSTVQSVLVQLEEMYRMKLENENAERVAEEQRLVREAEAEKLAEERVIEQKRIDKERAEMEEERAKLQADKDDIERESIEAKAEVTRLRAEAEEVKSKDELAKTEELERIESEKLAKVEEAERVKIEKAQIAKQKKLEKKQAQEREEQLVDRRTETIKALAEILRAEKPAVSIASYILGKIESGEVPNLSFS